MQGRFCHFHLCECVWLWSVLKLLIIPLLPFVRYFFHKQYVSNYTDQPQIECIQFLHLHVNWNKPCKANKHGKQHVLILQDRRIRGNEGRKKLIILLWSFKLDSDKWITKWTGAIAFSSCFCSQALWGVFYESATKITPQWLFASLL